MNSLTRDQLARLQRRQRQLVLAFAAALALFAFLLTVDLTVGIPPGATPYAYVSLGLLASAAAWVQFSAKCPNCGARIGFQSRLILPERCARCGVSFRRSR
jgi:hypothetical protein